MFGPEIQRLTDAIGADVGGARRNILRSVMAGGGDVSGTAAVLMKTLGQRGQRSIGDIIGEFTERTRRENLQERLRGDQLMTTAMGAQHGLFQDFAGLAGAERGRADRMRTADWQFFLDALGAGAGTAGQLQQNKLLRQILNPDPDEDPGAGSNVAELLPALAGRRGNVRWDVPEEFAVFSRGF